MKMKRDAVNLPPDARRILESIARDRSGGVDFSGRTDAEIIDAVTA